MEVQFETVYPAETMCLWTVKNPEKRLLGLAAERCTQLKNHKYEY